MTPSEEIVQGEKTEQDPLKHTVTIHFPEGFGKEGNAPVVTLGGRVWQGRLVGERRKHEFGQEEEEETTEER